MKAEYHNADHFKCNDLRRWKLTLWRGISIRLHHWVKGDPPYYQHQHPWSFLTIVLWGGYRDTGWGRPPDHVRAPAVRWRSRNWRHAVTNVKPGTWSIVITGPIRGEWRFWKVRFYKHHGWRAMPVTEAEWNERDC